jgi:hypothetical protein
MERGAERGGQKGLSGAAPARRYAAGAAWFGSKTLPPPGQESQTLGSEQTGSV